jgi:hypothetical protein
MKYGAYFAAKLIAAAAFLSLVWLAMNRLLPAPQPFLRYRVGRFAQDLPWTTAILVFWLLSLGLLALIVLDQRRRCRVCLAVLRMPVEHGSWSTATIFSPPRTESICPFGHGTLEVPEIQSTGHNPPSWHAHQDIWTELQKLDSGRK